MFFLFPALTCEESESLAISGTQITKEQPKSVANRLEVEFSDPGLVKKPFRPDPAKTKGVLDFVIKMNSDKDAKDAQSRLKKSYAFLCEIVHPSNLQLAINSTESWPASANDRPSTDQLSVAITLAALDAFRDSELLLAKWFKRSDLWTTKFHEMFPASSPTHLLANTRNRVEIQLPWLQIFMNRWERDLKMNTDDGLMRVYGRS